MSRVRGSGTDPRHAAARSAHWKGVIASILLTVQSLLTLTLPGDTPVRFGHPFPAAALERGLRVVGAPGAVLQWRPLSLDAAADPERIWVEVAIVGGAGRASIVAGGAGPTPTGVAGPCLTVVVTHPSAESARPDGTLDTALPRSRREFRWRDGSVDRVEVFDRPDGAQEVRIDGDLLARTIRVDVAADAWRAAGLLPMGREAGTAAWRARLAELLPAVVATGCDGAVGRGDHRRGEVCTNNEFDTALAWLRVGLAGLDRGGLERAWWAARHLAHVDLDRRSGLPFRHGPDHRVARPETGHVWVRGLLDTGLAFADEDLVQAARDLARALAKRMRERDAPTGPADRLRDEAWPLLELERHLRFEHTLPVANAADRLTARLVERFDDALGVLRYGEGETRGAVYRERVWQTVAIALPALRSHAERVGGDARIDAIVARTEARLVALWRRGGDGVPLGYAIAGAEPFDPVWRSGAAEAFAMLDGLSPGARQRLLRRASTRGGLEAGFDPDAEDVATRFTLIARCDWLWR